MGKSNFSRHLSHATLSDKSSKAYHVCCAHSWHCRLTPPLRILYLIKFRRWRSATTAELWFSFINKSFQVLTDTVFARTFDLTGSPSDSLISDSTAA